MLDSFNRPDSALGLAWSGTSGSDFYAIRGQQVYIFNDGPIYWQAGDPLGTNQEVFVTLTTIDPQSREHDLLLKVQGDTQPDWRKGAIEVLYDATANGGAGAVHVETYRPGQPSWAVYPSIAATYQAGDQIGARVLASGEVRVYKNGLHMGSVTLDADDQAFFNGRGGRIGLWFINAADAAFDDFGGGTIAR